MTKMNKILLLLSVGAIIFGVSFDAYPWSGDTHWGITNETEKQDEVLDDYLIQIGFPNGRQTTFALLDSLLYQTPILKKRINDGYITFDNGVKSRTALDWLVNASVEEDNPLPRASDHFHDPTG